MIVIVVMLVGVPVIVAVMDVRRAEIGPTAEVQPFPVDQHICHRGHVVHAVTRCSRMDDLKQLQHGQTNAALPGQQAPTMRRRVHVFGHQLRLRELVRQHHVGRQALGDEPVAALMPALGEIGESQPLTLHGADGFMHQHLVAENKFAGMAGRAVALKRNDRRGCTVRMCDCSRLRQRTLDGRRGRPRVTDRARQRLQTGMLGDVNHVRIKTQSNLLQADKVAAYCQQRTVAFVDQPRVERRLPCIQFDFNAFQQARLAGCQVTPARDTRRLRQRNDGNCYSKASLRHQPRQRVFRNGQVGRTGVPQFVQQVVQRNTGARRGLCRIVQIKGDGERAIGIVPDHAALQR